MAGSLIKVPPFERLTPQEVEAFKLVAPVYPFSSTPYYLELAFENAPIRKMVFPSLEEIDPSVQSVGEEDPLKEERDKKTLYLTHRYPDRVLVVVTNFCPVLCRFCMRKRNWRKPTFFIDEKGIEEVVRYVWENKGIRDVLISGGDPFYLKKERLEALITELEKIPHVDLIRIGTRSPVVDPYYVLESGILEVLEKGKRLWINVHYNHPAELTEVSIKALRKIQKLGIPINNQTVLLKGVNDKKEVIEELCRKLQRVRVRPYYLFRCDPVKGTIHFATSISKGLEIIRYLYSKLSPLAIPCYAVDLPGGLGKVPLMPERYKRDGDWFVLESYKGEKVRLRDNYLPEGAGN